MDGFALHADRMSDLAALIARRLGLHYPQTKQGELGQKVVRLARTLGFSSPDECLKWLLSPVDEEEATRRLTAACTIGETYFYREPGALDFFMENAVPVLLAGARASGRPLRVWCAGCCTGEEAYTLAILLRESFHRHGAFEFGVWATDVNPDYLAKARAGTYGPWSFRSKSVRPRHHYFSSSQKQLTVSPDIRGYVRFDVLNLADNIYPGVFGEPGYFDAIFCRNVLMYFTEKAVQKTMRHFRTTLTEDGWLFVSGVESSILNLGNFRRDSLPPFAATKGASHSVLDPSVALASLSNTLPPVHGEFVPPQNGAEIHSFHLTDELDVSPIYASATMVTPNAANNFGAQSDAIAAEPKPELKVDIESDYGRARQLEADGRHEEACELLSQSAERATDSTTQLLYARLCHLCGRLDEAAAACGELLDADKLCVEAYWILAAALRESGEINAALAALQSALYLAPDAGWVHLQLGFVCRELARFRQSRIHFRNAADLLESLGSETAVPELGDLTAGRLAEIAREMAAESLTV